MKDKQNVVTRPYRGADIVKEQKSNLNAVTPYDPFDNEDDGYYEQDMSEEEYADSVNKDADDADVSTVSFAEDIKVHFIPSIDFRIMCHFLGLTSVNDVKNHPYSECPLITMMSMESLVKFMESEGYSFEGELNFDRQGNSIPADKTVWKIKGEEVSFTTTGFMYFKNTKSKDNNSNLVFYVFTNLDQGVASITCYTPSEKASEDTIQKMEQFTKDNNCLRGLKLRDVNMYSGDFTEVEPRPECNWENYYFTEDVKDIFELEVFGFLQNVDKYNEHGITKRGVMLHGAPGCVVKGTKIKIRKKKKEGKHNIFYK